MPDPAPAPAVAAAPPLAVVPEDPIAAPWSTEEVRANALWAVVTTAGLAAVFAALRLLPSVGWPLLIATGFAYLFHPIITWATTKGLSRSGATALLMVTGAMISALLGLVLAPLGFAQLTRLPAYLLSTLDALLPRLEQVFGRELPASYKDLLELAGRHAQEIVTQVLPSATTVVGTIAQGSLSILSFVLSALIIPVVGFYLLRGWPNVLERLDALVPERHRPTMHQRLHEANTMLGGFIRGQLTLAALLSVLYAAALSVIGLKLALVVGLVTGFGNLVPYVGVGTGFALAIGFSLVDFGVDYHLVAVAVTYAALLATDGVFITPRIVGDRVGLSPAAVIVAVLACGSMFGFAGVLLAVPTAAILKLVLRVSVRVYRHSRFYLGS